MSGFKKFTFDENNNVIGMFEVERSKMKAEKISDKTFEVQETVDQTDVLSVTSTKVTSSSIETKVYQDLDLNNLFEEAFEFKVSSSVSSKNAETYKFSNADGFLNGLSSEDQAVVAVQELGKKGWKNDSIDVNELLKTVSLNGETYVVKTETSRNGDVEFDLFRDDDLDGKWTKVAEGEATSLYLTDLGGFDNLLANLNLSPSESIIG